MMRRFDIAKKHVQDNIDGIAKNNGDFYLPLGPAKHLIKNVSKIVNTKTTALKKKKQDIRFKFNKKQDLRRHAKIASPPSTPVQHEEREVKQGQVHPG